MLSLQMSTRWPTGSWRAIHICMAVFCLLGCNRPAWQRVAVEGNITVDGKPLAHGAIVFVPRQGTTGPRAATEVRDGTYRLDAEHGPAVGQFLVQIWGRDESGLKDIKQAESNGVTSVPRQYNSQSTLSVETTAEGENRFDFDLKSIKSTSAHQPVLR